jgi:hypothetical protein
LRDDLRDETAEREAQQIDLAKTESAYERDGIPSHLLDRFGGRTSGSADPTIVEHNNVVVPVGNSRPDILVVQPTQYRYGQGLTDGPDGAGDRRVLLQR